MIHIITTGGTIEGTDIDKLSGENKTNSYNISIETFLDKANVTFSYRIEKVFDKDSREIDSDDLDILQNAISHSDSQQILITHGTFTMENTAKFLGENHINKTIVLVGSFISGDLKETDAPFNLGYAIGALQLLKPDVYIAMNGKIFHWSNVRKNLETNCFEKRRG